MSEVNRTPASQGYERKWDQLLSKKNTHYVPEKYQLGIVADYLSQHDITFTTEGEVFCYPIDILGLKRDSTLAIELKSRNVERGIEQATRNADFVDYSFLSVWDTKITNDLTDRISNLSIGLIGVDETVRIYSGPHKTDKQLCSSSSVIKVITNDVRGDSQI